MRTGAFDAGCTPARDWQNAFCYNSAMQKKTTGKDGGIKAVVVLSGGQDSATCLALAVKKYGAMHVAAITFRYGQRHSVETKFASRLAGEIFKVRAWMCLPLDFYGQITSNALFDKSEKIAKRKGAKCPNTVVEGRNAIFLQIASVWAKRLGAKEVYTGVSEADYSGYPDCREEFIKAQQRAIRLALDYPVRIVTPFMHMSKAEEWALADKLGIVDIVMDKTVTCYNGIPGKGCGKCPACKLRNQGLEKYLSTRRQAAATGSRRRAPRGP